MVKKKLQQGINNLKMVSKIKGETQIIKKLEETLQE